MVSRSTCSYDPAVSLERISASAQRDWAVPASLAEEARAATMRRFAARPGAEERIADRRLEAYFWGVVRRRAFRGGDETRELRQRFVEASLAA